MEVDVTDGLDVDVRNVVVIGASAGGVQALISLFENLPSHVPAAFLVVLHIPAYEPSVLHKILSRSTSMRVVAARDGERIQPGTVYVAVADRHLMLMHEGIRLTRGPKECRVRPAVDVLFRSAAASYGARVMGMILSGALDDGTAGLWAVKDRGGMTFVQDPSQAMLSSMPESAIQHVQIDLIGSIATIAQQIAETVGSRADRLPHNGQTPHEIENTISLKGNGLEAGVMGLGKVSQFTCPDCHGVLVQIEEGSIVRFRCHTGHAFSMKSLICEVNAAIDIGLWDTLRAVEERILLLRQMSDQATVVGASHDAADCLKQADAAEKRLQPLRALVLDPTFFGHDDAK
ncbi:chemotaxis protein CheB [Pseudomonas fluorescens]|nr:chemotaxis protein CheB [Pseudomonas fluorescens]OEC52687.1 chemotaxis protein CheB [Pseudomonas sp. AP42]